MEPTQPTNPVIPLDPVCRKAVALFAREMKFPVESILPEGWGVMTMPQAERSVYLRVAGEEDKKAGTIEVFELCQMLENTPRDNWAGQLIGKVSAARWQAGIQPWDDLLATIEIYRRVNATAQLMVRL